MTPRDARELAETAVTALQQTGQRGILSTGWGGLKQEMLNLPDDVLVVDQAPHDWLFPRMAAVVHHGGAGTTAAGLRAGVPTITVPFFFDQPFWGQQVARLGAGPPPIPHKRITAANLAAAIHRAVTDERMQARAAELGRRIRAEDGVAMAVQCLK
jgi:UDP:flavonoid glycosyltransferase YjiC (YdhE family)